MRIRFNDNGKYPWVNKNSFEEWKTGEAFIITPARDQKYHHGRKKNCVVGTFLKAFDGAPKWTKDELEKFVTCLEKIGLVKKERVNMKTLNKYPK